MGEARLDETLTELLDRCRVAEADLLALTIDEADQIHKELDFD